MAKYAARVNVPHPQYGEGGDGVVINYGHSIREIMVDNIKAKSRRLALKLAKSEAERYVDYIWGDIDDIGTLPEVSVIDCARIGSDGNPVRKDFPSPSVAKTRVQSVGARRTDSAQTPELGKPEPKPVTKKVKVLDLKDPLSEELIALAALNVDE